MSSTITYNEPLVTYNDPCYLYNGYNICQPQPKPVAQQRPGYWMGRSSERRREEEQKRKRNFLSIAVQAQPLSVNGYDVHLDVKEIRFAGEDTEPFITVEPASLTKPSTSYKIFSSPLTTTLIDPIVASEGIIEGQLLPELRGELLDPLEEEREIEEEEVQVMGDLYCEEKILVESLLLTGSTQDLTLSCMPIKGHDTYFKADK